NASDGPLCANAIMDDDCISDPFTAGCSTEEVARSIRESFCRKSTNATDNPTLCGNAVVHFCTNDPLDGLCDQMTQKMRLCTNDPFTAGCDPGTYSSERATRITTCITGDNASDDALCANAILDDSCIRDPYVGGCEGETDARTARESYCRGNDNPTLCGQAITHFCTADPFDGLCDPGIYSNERDTRVTACIAGDKADDPTCTNAVVANPCIRNPFNTNCKDDFANYYLSARTNRETFCKGRTDVTYDLTLCAGAIVHVCEADPFETLCNNNNNDDYARQKMERVDFCIRDDNASDTDLCMGAIAAAIVAGLNCITDPYATGCESKLTARAARESYCRGNTNPTLCGMAVTHFCGIDPFDDLCDEGTYSVQRGDRVTTCITGDNASDDALCANA
ncbi:MAG: hypothetical protein K8953_06975, partial [Proteobacteria bacterium]|nr:hypothetical protein [Pseudomonadota bacterium]